MPYHTSSNNYQAPPSQANKTLYVVSATSNERINELLLTNEQIQTQQEKNSWSFKVAQTKISPKICSIMKLLRHLL